MFVFISHFHRGYSYGHIRYLKLVIVCAFVLKIVNAFLGITWVDHGV